MQGDYHFSVLKIEARATQPSVPWYLIVSCVQKTAGVYRSFFLKKCISVDLYSMLPTWNNCPIVNDQVSWRIAFLKHPVYSVFGWGPYSVRMCKVIFWVNSSKHNISNPHISTGSARYWRIFAFTAASSVTSAGGFIIHWGKQLWEFPSFLPVASKNATKHH